MSCRQAGTPEFWAVFRWSSYDRPVAQGGSRLLLNGACLVVVLAGLKSAEAFLVPLVFSAFLGVLAAPAVLWLRERKVPTSAAVPLVMLLVIVVLSLVGGMVGGSVNRFTEELPKYQARSEGIIESISSLLGSQGIEVSQKRVLGLVDPGASLKLVGKTVSGLAGLLSNTLLVVLTMVFILFEAVAVPQKLRAALGDPTADLGRYSRVTGEIKQYLVIKTYLSLATGLCVGLLVWVLGVDFPLLWGLVAFLLNYVPNLGSIIAGLPPVLLALIQHGPMRALIVLGGIVAINLVFGNVVEPNLMGRRLGISTLVVFLSLLFWGWLWGPVGMLLSVPLTMIVKISLETSPEWGWVSILMGGERDAEEAVSSRAPG